MGALRRRTEFGLGLNLGLFASVNPANQGGEVRRVCVEKPGDTEVLRNQRVPGPEPHSGALPGCATSRLSLFERGIMPNHGLVVHPEISEGVHLPGHSAYPARANCKPADISPNAPRLNR